MPTTAITTAFRSTGSALFADGPRVAERSRGTAHPAVATTRSLLALRSVRRPRTARRP